MTVPLTTLMTNPLSAVVGSNTLSSASDALGLYVQWCIGQNVNIYGIPNGNIAGAWGSQSQAPNNAFMSTQPSISTNAVLISSALLSRLLAGH